MPDSDRTPDNPEKKPFDAWLKSIIQRIFSETPTEFVLRGGKAIRFVAIAIGHEIDRLMVVAEGTEDEDERADALNDLGLYRAILTDMGDPR